MYLTWISRTISPTSGASVIEAARRWIDCSGLARAIMSPRKSPYGEPAFIRENGRTIVRRVRGSHLFVGGRRSCCAFRIASTRHVTFRVLATERRQSSTVTRTQARVPPVRQLRNILTTANAGRRCANVCLSPEQRTKMRPLGLSS